MTRLIYIVNENFFTNWILNLADSKLNSGSNNHVEQNEELSTPVTVWRTDANGRPIPTDEYEDEESDDEDDEEEDQEITVPLTISMIVLFSKFTLSINS